MNLQALWQRLSAAGLTQGAEPEHDQTESELWYVRVLQGFAGWLAALFVLAFLGFGIAGLFDHGAVLLTLGMIMNVVAYGYYKGGANSDFMEQVMLVTSLCGQFLFVAGLFVTMGFEFFAKDHRQWLVVVALYQLLLVFMMQHFLHRFLSAWFAMMAVFWAFDFWLLTGFGTALTAAVLVWLWLDKVGWHAQKNLYEPVGYALVFALIQFSIHGMDKSLFWYSRGGEPSWLMLHGDWFAVILNGAVLLYLLYRLFKEQGVDAKQTEGQLLWGGAILVVLATLPIKGLSAALVVLLLGVARQNRVLQVLGVLALLGCVSWYYYWMQQTLLFKSMLLMGFGALMLAVAWLWRRQLAADSITQIQSGSVAKRWTHWVPLLVVALVLVIMNREISHKEQVLSEGETVLLNLAPVDPRSIMQGDYMRLRFAIGNEIRTKVYEDKSIPFNHTGHIVVSKDANQVASLVRLDQGEVLNAGEFRMQYRVRGGRVKLATNAFFFQEGQAKLYDQAQFGVFKVDTDGSLLLYAMADAQHQILGVNRLVE